MKNFSTSCLLKIFFFSCLLGQFEAAAQNFTGGFSFNIPFDDGTASPLFPNFPARVITEAGRVSVSGSSFVVGGKPQRFWGVNMVAASAFPAKTNAPKIATHARKMGINLVRFHHLDNPSWTSDGSIFVGGQSTRTLNLSTLDRLEFLINELKKNNIYVNMNLNVSRTFNAQDGVLHADSLKEFAKGVTIFDPQLIALQKEYARQLFAHVNPYTGMRLSDDPTLAMVEMINENSLYGMWKENQLKTTKLGGNLLVRHAIRLDSLWNIFLVNKYQTQSQLQTAWAVAGGTSINRVADGGFEGTTLNANWQLEQNGGAMATVSQDATQPYAGSKSAKITVATKGTEGWHLQFKFVGFSLKKDSSYIIQFVAKSAQNTTISAALTRDNSPYTWYGGQDVNLTTNWQTFKMTIQATEDNLAQGRLTFSLGKANGPIWIDAVSLTEPLRKSFITGENLTVKNIQRVDYSDQSSFSKQRVADLAQFYINLQKALMEDMRLFLKNDLGVRAPITGTNALVGIQEGLEHENMDYYDDHSYWDHPSFPNGDWSSSNWFIANQQMTKNAGFGAIPIAFSGVGLANKPFTLSEYNHGFPNRFRTEMVPAMAAYGAYHGMDGVMFFDYNSETDNSWSRDFVSGFFSIHRDHATMGLFPSCAFAYRNGLIAESSQPIAVNYSERDVYWSFEKDRQGRWGRYVPYDYKLQLTRSLRAGTYHHSQGISAQTLPATSQNVFQTDTRETSLDVTKGLLTTATPKFVAVSGSLNAGANTKVGALTLTSSNDFGVLTWLSISNKALTDADTSFFTISSKIQNTGMIWNTTNTTVSGNWGSNPTSIFPLSVKVRLNVNANSLRIIRLSNVGKAVATRTIRATTLNNFDLTINQNTDRTLWYAIVAVKTAAATGIAPEDNSDQFLVAYPNPIVQGQLTVEYKAIDNQPVETQLIDSYGRVVLRQINSEIEAGDNQTILNTKSLSQGIYFLRVGSKTKKIVIQ